MTLSFASSANIECDASFSVMRSLVDFTPNKAPHSIHAKGSSSFRTLFQVLWHEKPYLNNFECNYTISVIRSWFGSNINRVYFFTHLTRVKFVINVPVVMMGCDSFQKLDGKISIHFDSSNED